MAEKKISMDTPVRLVNDGKIFRSKWDGKLVEIPKGKHIEVVYGLALHFKAQSDDLRIEEIKEEVPAEKEVKDPLGDDKGDAFTDLEDE